MLFVTDELPYFENTILQIVSQIPTDEPDDRGCTDAVAEVFQLRARYCPQSPNIYMRRRFQSSVTMMRRDI